MKKKQIASTLAGLALSFLLAGCAGGLSSENSSDSLSSESSEPSSESSSESSFEESSSSSQSEEPTEQEKANYGTPYELTREMSFQNGYVSSLKKSVCKQIYKNASSETTTDTILTQTKLSVLTKSTQTLSSGTSSASSVISFIGIKDDVCYTYYENGDTKQTERNKVVESATLSDEITLDDAKTNIANAISTSYLELPIFTNFSSDKYTISEDLAISIKDDDERLVQVIGSAYCEPTKNSPSAATFLLRFDGKGYLRSGQYVTETYAKTDWDSTTHAPNDGATASYVQTTIIVSASYGNPVSETTLPFEESDPLWVTSVSGINIYSETSTYDDATGEYVTTTENHPEAGRSVYLNNPNDQSNGAFTYEPSTAIDVSSIRILKVSNNVMTQDKNGSWKLYEGVATGLEITVTVGNAFYQQDVYVTVAKNTNPVAANLDTGTEDSPINPFEIVETTKGSVALEKGTYGQIPTFSLKVLNEEVLFKARTTNNGPFDFTMWIDTDSSPLDTDYLTIRIPEDQSDALSNLGSNGVYFYITLKKAPTDYVNFVLAYGCDPKTYSDKKISYESRVHYAA